MSQHSTEALKNPGAGDTLLAIVGPTGVGKTALGVALAKHFPIEVVSVDSRQVYRHMDIGTAKPTSEELARVPHHLINVADPADDFSLATYLDLARAAITDIRGRGNLPALVGGTGQYLWALLEDWRVPAVPPDPAYRDDLAALAQAQGPGTLHARLTSVDPDAAATIDPRNQRRVIRALEVHHQTGVPFSEMRRKGKEAYPACIIGLTLPRDELYIRIDKRVDHMLEAGWIEEVKRLLSRGVTLAHSAMASVGYMELASVLGGTLAMGEANRIINTATHRFARHQYAWFRLSDPRIHWLDASQPGMENSARALIASCVGEA